MASTARRSRPRTPETPEANARATAPPETASRPPADPDTSDPDADPPAATADTDPPAGPDPNVDGDQGDDGDQDDGDEEDLVPVRFLVCIAGPDLVYVPGSIVHLPAAQAEGWCDGVRAERADEPAQG